jgi:hypothetical protein
MIVGPQYVHQTSLKKVMISQGHRCLGESLGIHFSPGILAFTLDTQKLTRIEYIFIFQAEISIGDVFAYTPFMSNKYFK